VKEFNNWEPTDFIWQVRMYQETVTMIDNLVPVTIAAVDGVCTGGGLELTLVCDFLVAANRSRWGMPEINWDITPGWGGTAKIAKSQGVEPHRPSRPSRETLRMFALNPKPRLKPRFVLTVRQ
jgi:enoyl-CoA hydratase/carnithine racemase